MGMICINNITRGGLDVDWIIEGPLKFHTFCVILCCQMLSYGLKDQLYPGSNKKTRYVMQMNRKNSQKHHGCRGYDGPIGEYVGYHQYKEIIRSPQFCTDLLQ